MVGTGTGPVLLVQVLILGGCVVDTVWSYWGEVMFFVVRGIATKAKGWMAGGGRWEVF